ncbi:HTH domain-containing protein [Desulfonema limicola]|uniref:HTH domain-containing protein n=1 Tax=Desulfonema limicola TaxID=45656 RepID=A0A975BBL0_9BACT|nr:helix-turn-helix domain-containing protein [Desulfonema limicola]QTA82341.1 HTH domain-containing protein [Desulfonema limicola]
MNQDDLATVKEVSGILKMSKQTIYNKIHKKEFIKNKHYYKPSPKKILFKLSEIKKWLKGGEGNAHSSNSDFKTEVVPLKQEQKRQTPQPCLINI